MGNDMDKKGILTVRMMGTISVEYEGEFFPVGTALTGKILQLLLILLYAGKKGVGREELLDVFYGNGEYANPSGSLRAAVFRLRRLLKEMLPEHEYICTDGGIYRWDEGNVTVSIDARKSSSKCSCNRKKRGTVPRLQLVLWGIPFPDDRRKMGQCDRSKIPGAVF